MKELVCTPKRISLKKESPRAMPIHTSTRHNALPARVGENSRRNISFDASCSFNQWHLWAWRCASRVAYVCAKIRRREDAPREKLESRDPERNGPPKNMARFILRLFTQLLFIDFETSQRRIVADRLRLLVAINCGDHVSGIYSFRIINHHNAISVNSIRYCWSLLHQV